MKRITETLWLACLRAGALCLSLCAVTAAGLLVAAGCGNKTNEAATTTAKAATAAVVAPPAGTGAARRGNPEPDAAAKAAAFKAARDKAEGR